MPGRTSASRRDALPPQRKRSRRVLEDDAPAAESDMEVVDVAEASSSLQHATQRTKRVRISDAKDMLARERSASDRTPGSESSDSAPPRRVRAAEAGGDGDGGGGGDNEDDDDAPPPASQYELMRDMGFEHLQHEEDDDMVATQRLQQRALRSATMALETSGENRQAVNGIIERVTCVNFMCHTRLECELGPLLNFIVGENGSGKSAILTAITLCLGAKASSTNRGGSLKHFIKQGEERGFLAVRIKNCGDDAYQHDVYGDSIIVERHFSKSGASSFKLKSATERLISTKRADVDDIVEYYYLQVDNPLIVLSQDNARQFLNSSSAALKYKFFIQGVQLEQLDKDYELVKQFLDAHNEQMPQMQERVEQLLANYEEAKHVYRLIQDNQEMRKQKRIYLNQLAWSQVAEQEGILASYEQTVTQAASNLAEAEQLKVAATQKLEIENDKLQRARSTHAAFQEDEGLYEENMARAQKKHDDAVSDLRALHADERDIHSRLKGVADRIKELEGKIRDEQRRLEDASGDQRREVQARLDAALEKRQQMEQDVRRENDRLPDLEKARAEAHDALERLKPALERKGKEVKEREASIRSLGQNRGTASPYEAYDRRMAELVAQVERDGRFSRKPIGPLGTKMRVLKPVWAPILEKTFGASLNGFIVTSHHDQQLLTGMIKRLNMQNVPVFIANPQPINTQGREPDAQFDTILRILEFDEPLIRDQLIINSYIEQIILVEDRKRAEQIMFNGPAPQNVSGCISLHDKKRGEGLRLTNRGGGSVSTTPVVPSFSQKPRMRTDVSSQIAIQGEILTQAQQELAALRAQYDGLRQGEQRCLDDIKTHGRRMDVLRRALRTMEGTIRQIEEERDVYDGADGRLHLYEQELAVAKEQKEQVGGQYGDVNVRKNQQSQVVEEAKRALEEETMKKRDYEAKMEKLLRSVEKHTDLRRVALVAKNEAFESVDMLRQELALAERKREEQAGVVAEFTEQAERVSPVRVAIPEGETYALIEKKMDTLVKELNERRKRLGMSDEEVSDRMAAAKQAYERMEEVYRVSLEHIEAIEQALVARLVKWRLFQRYISATSRTNFIYLLSERGYRGRLLIDHKRKRLRVEVEPDETRRTVSGRDTRTLSGGEKSFSSICLLLSIWEAMGSPLRCLDEFDVFMDNVNRDVSTTMLVDSARRSVGRQYIFITPNAIQGAARHAPDVKIIRLTDPRQRTLDSMA